MGIATDDLIFEPCANVSLERPGAPIKIEYWYVSDVYGTAGTELLPSWRCFGGGDAAKPEVQRILDEWQSQGVEQRHWERDLSGYSRETGMAKDRVRGCCGTAEVGAGRSVESGLGWKDRKITNWKLEIGKREWRRGLGDESAEPMRWH